MRITMDIPAELESSLEAAAKASGVEIARWASDVVTDRLKQAASAPADKSDTAESDRLRASFMARLAEIGDGSALEMIPEP